MNMHSLASKTTNTEKLSLRSLYTSKKLEMLLVQKNALEFVFHFMRKASLNITETFKIRHREPDVCPQKHFAINLLFVLFYFHILASSVISISVSAYSYIYFRDHSSNILPYSTSYFILNSSTHIHSTQMLNHSAVHHTKRIQTIF